MSDTPLVLPPAYSVFPTFYIPSGRPEDSRQLAIYLEAVKAHYSVGDCTYFNVFYGLSFSAAIRVILSRDRNLLKTLNVKTYKVERTPTGVDITVLSFGFIEAFNSALRNPTATPFVSAEEMVNAVKNVEDVYRVKIPVISDDTPSDTFYLPVPGIGGGSNIRNRLMLYLTTV